MYCANDHLQSSVQMSTDPVVPFPGFRVNGLSHSAQHLQGALVTPLHVLIPFPHQSSDQCWSCVELLHLQQ